MKRLIACLTAVISLTLIVPVSAAHARHVTLAQATELDSRAESAYAGVPVQAHCQRGPKGNYGCDWSFCDQLVSNAQVTASGGFWAYGHDAVMSDGRVLEDRWTHLGGLC